MVKMGKNILKGTRISKAFGGLVAVDKMDFYLKEGEILGLIGPNGSGKTTLLNVICGMLRADSGEIYFKGKNVTKLTPDKICKMGIAKTNQIPRLFQEMSVLENIAIGSLYGKDVKIGVSKAKEEALRWLDFLEISEKASIVAKDLTFVDCKKVELARALATKPKVLLVDEVVSGLSEAEMRDSLKIMRKIRDELGITILWVEHVMRAIMKYAERIIVINFGRKIAEGTPKEITNNPIVKKTYLGEF